MLSFAFVATFYETAHAVDKNLVKGGLLGAGAVGLTAAAAAGGGAAMTAGIATAGFGIGNILLFSATWIVNGLVYLNMALGAFVGLPVYAVIGGAGALISAATSSALFLPAVIIAAAAASGYFIYKYVKNKKAKEAISPFGAPNANKIGRITDSAQTANEKLAASTTAAKKSGRITDEVQTPPAADSLVAAHNPSLPAEIIPGIAAPAKSSQKNNNSSSQALKKKYDIAYQNYMHLLENDTSNGASAEVTQAYEQFKSAQSEYRDYIKANPEVSK